MRVELMSPSPNQRIIGLDFARGIAVWGMILMNFKIVMSDDTSGVLGKVTHFMEGHYGVMFVVLAGIGISLFMKKAIASGNKKLIMEKKLILLKRSCFLVVIGLLFSFIWQADILHYYGFYIVIGAICVNLSKKALWILIALFTLAFPLLFLTISYEAGWDWSALTYVEFWSVRGFIRHTFFNGFHPVFPWISFLLVGILFGRLEFSSKNLRKYLVISILVAVGAEVLSYILVSNTSEPLSYLFSRDAMPPAPLFVIAGAAEGFIMIIISIYISKILEKSKLIKPVVFTGQMVLSHYILHVFIGLGLLEMVGRMRGQTLIFSVIYSTVYFGFSVWFSFLWGRKFKRGPFELVMRKISG